MLDRDLSDDDRIAGLASVYGAARARARSDEAGVAGADPEGAVPVVNAEENELRILPLALAGSAGAGMPMPPADWSSTINLVERAAATIKAYERRFLQLDIHTRALMERAAEEQARLHEQVLALEERLRDSEERAARAETATRDEAFFRWEAERRLRETESRLAEAQDHSRLSEDYLRRVHSVLAEI